MAIDPPAFILVFFVLPAIFELVVSILLYRLAFRKRSRIRANTLSWLITVGLGLVIEIILSAVLSSELGFGALAMIVVAPALGVGLPLLWALIRYIYIKATPGKARNFTQKTPEPTLG